MIYLIRAGESGPFCKIGKADDPETRLRELQCGNPEVLILAKVWPGDLLEEAALHRAFSDRRYRGEWFHYSDAMLGADPAALARDMPTAKPFVAPDAVDPILPNIEEFLVASGISATAFGIAAAGDPLLVADLRRGRELRRATRARISNFLAEEARAP